MQVTEHRMTDQHCHSIAMLSPFRQPTTNLVPAGLLLQVHLFDIDIPGKITFKESLTLTPGQGLTVVDSEASTACYVLPALYCMCCTACSAAACPTACCRPACPACLLSHSLQHARLPACLLSHVSPHLPG